MHQTVHNRSSRYAYFDERTLSLRQDIMELLTVTRIRRADLKAHEANVSLGVERPDRYKSVLRGIVPIPPKSRWLYDGRTYVSCNRSAIPHGLTYDFDDIIETCRRLLRQARLATVGVDFSGGLDTSVILAVLERCNVKPVLVGFANKRYEFRTEAVIQKIYAAKFDMACLLDNEQHLPFAKLMHAPLHQLPSVASLSYDMANQLARGFSERGVSVALNGMGMDAVFCDYPCEDGRRRHPERWFTWMLDSNWLNENIFDRYGVTYRPAVSSRRLIRMIWQMRQGQQEDLRKVWARRQFAEYLPARLTSYAYKAAFDGLFQDGLSKARNDIAELFKVTYELTGFEEFKPKSLNHLIDKVLTAPDDLEMLFISRLSFACWIFALARDLIQV